MAADEASSHFQLIGVHRRFLGVLGVSVLPVKR